MPTSVRAAWLMRTSRGKYRTREVASIAPVADEKPRRARDAPGQPTAAGGGSEVTGDRPEPVVESDRLAVGVGRRVHRAVDAAGEEADARAEREIAAPVAAVGDQRHAGADRQAGDAAVQRILRDHGDGAPLRLDATDLGQLILRLRLLL